MPSRRSLFTFSIALTSGLLLLTSGTHGPTGTYKLIIEQLPNFIENQQILQTANIVATALITISLAGGLVVITGGILILMHHVSIGKIVIGLGAGAGIPWLIMLAITLITTGQVAAVIAEYSSIGWTGMILAFVARMIAK